LPCSAVANDPGADRYEHRYRRLLSEIVHGPSGDIKMAMDIVVDRVGPTGKSCFNEWDGDARRPQAILPKVSLTDFVWEKPAGGRGGLHGLHRQEGCFGIPLLIAGLTASEGQHANLTQPAAMNLITVTAVLSYEPFFFFCFPALVLCAADLSPGYPVDVGSRACDTCVDRPRLRGPRFSPSSR
jgi:hypothetical protein